MTDSQTALQTSESITQLDKYGQDQSIERRSPKSLDDCYIECFLESPLNKSEAYLKACDLMEVHCSEQYVRQYAHSIHRRLSERINTELRLLTIDDTAYGRSVTRYLAEHSTSDSVRAQTAKTLTGSHYSTDNDQASGVSVTVKRDSVSITHKNQTLTVETDKSE